MVAKKMMKMSILREEVDGEANHLKIPLSLSLATMLVNVEKEQVVAAVAVKEDQRGRKLRSLVTR